jgi:hypothetical protein
VAVRIFSGGDQPPQAVYEDNPQMQALIGQLPSQKAAPPAPPRRVR